MKHHTTIATPALNDFFSLLDEEMLDAEVFPDMHLLGYDGQVDTFMHEEEEELVNWNA